MAGKRSWVIAAAIAAGVAVMTGGVGVVSAATRTGCDVVYTVSTQWVNGFNANLRVRNTGTTPVKGWSLGWRFAGDQQVTQGRNATITQSGSAVTARGAPNSTNTPGAHLQFGFTGSYTGSNARPTVFTLNGVTCTVEGGPAGKPLGAGRIQYGPVYSGEGTFYGGTGEGGNCSYEASADRMIAAMNQTDYQNSQACGAYLAVTGPNGAKVTVKVVDRCPECKPGDLDLSTEAFAKLSALSAGRIKISWTLLSPTLSGPVTFTYKDGSSRYWCAIQVRNHRNPVRSLEVLVGGGWKSLPRQDYNYFLSANGSGCGNSLRVTDIYGHQLTRSGLAIRPGTAQSGTAQSGTAQSGTGQSGTGQFGTGQFGTGQFGAPS